jgi:D-xylose transport system permease protein
MAAALAGLLYAGRLEGARYTLGGEADLMTVLAAAIIGGTSLFGGKGRALDGLLGAGVIVVITNGMTLQGAPQGRVYMITGGVLLLAASVDAISRRKAAASGRV